MKPRTLFLSTLLSAALFAALVILNSDHSGPDAPSASNPAQAVDAADLKEATATSAALCCEGDHRAHGIGLARASDSTAARAVHKKALKKQVNESSALVEDVFRRLEGKKIGLREDDLSFIRSAQVGDQVTLDLVDFTLSGRVAAVRRLDELATVSLNIENGLGKASLTLRGDGRLFANVFFHEESRAIKIRNSDLSGYLATAATVSELLCAPSEAVFPSAASMRATSQAGNAPTRAAIGGASGLVPVALSSLPTSDYVIYLDFDGELVTAPDWTFYNGDEPFNTEPHPQAFNPEWVEVVWERVAEDFAPFDVNVTTDRSVYNATPVANRVMTIITPTNEIEDGIGGVAFLNTFGFEIPAFAFNLQEYDCADTISHEVGHTLGLVHDGKAEETFNDGSIDEYFGGHGSGVTSWAPIMGAAFQEGNSAVTQWSFNEYADAVNYFTDEPSTDYQDDLVQITSNGFGFRPDDAGNAIATAANLNSDGSIINQSGIIEQNDDIDFFQFSSLEGATEIQVNPLDVESDQDESGSDIAGANLAVEIALYDSDQNLIVSENPSDALGATLSANLAEGLNYLSIRGAGRGDPLDSGFSDYASLGQYTVTGILPSGPLTVRGGPDASIIINGDRAPTREDGTNLGRLFVGEIDPLIGSFNLINNGIDPLQIDSVAIDSPAFVLTAVTPITILPGETIALEIGFLPGEPGVLNGDVSMTYSIPAAPGETFEYLFSIQGVGSKFENDDNYEQNDTFFEPYPLAPLTPLENLAGLGVQSDNDWYRIDVPAGLNELEIVSTATGGDSNIGIALYDEIGYQLSLSQGNGGEETIRYLAAPEGGIFHIVVFGDNEGNEYNLRWQGLSPLIATAATEDAYENNDILENAFPFVAGGPQRLSEIDGDGTQLDNDWFRIPVGPNERRVTINLEETGFLGGISMDIYSNGRNVTAFAAKGENTIAFDVPVGVSGIKVVVYGDNAGAPYDLTYTTEAVPSPPVDDQGDDPYEENDTFFEARDITNQRGVLLSAGLGVGVQFDLDWYQIRLPEGDNSLELNFPEGQPDGPEFYIYDSRGYQLTGGNSIAGRENFRFRNFAADSNIYHMVVTGGNAGTTYDFSWTSFTAVDGEDFYEENDTLETAFDISDSPIEFISRISGFGIQSDEDWYKIRSSEGDEIIDVLLDVDQSAANVILELFDASGTLLAISDETTGNESIVFESDTTEATDYFIRISGDNAQVQYDLRWLSRGVITDDNYEPNNTILEAFELPGESARLSEIDGLGIQADFDYYRFEFSQDALAVNLVVEFSHDEGDIVLNVFDGRGRFIEGGFTSTDNETANFSVTAGDRKIIYVLVFFADTGSAYDMVWDVSFLNDTNGNLVSDDFEVAQGLLADNLDYDSNVDGDRYPLWAEFAAGLSPHEHDEPKVDIQQVDGYFEVSFTRSVSAMAAGYQVRVFESTNMLEWDDANMVEIDRTSDGLPADIERVTMRSSRPVSETDKRFFKLSTIPLPE